MSAATATCKKCTDTPCPMCRRPFIHRSIALQQPYESVMIETPPLYKLLFPTDFVLESTQTPYHTLIIAYSSVLAHLNDLLNPSQFWLSEEWTRGARPRREMAYALWEPYLQTHRTQHIPYAFAQEKFPQLGRAAMLRAYQMVIAAGVLAARCTDVADFENRIAGFLSVYAAAPIHETGDGHRISEVRAFNQKHREWRASDSYVRT